MEENLRTSGSSSLSLHLDPNITPEDFNRNRSIHAWKAKKTGREAEALVQQILVERRAARREVGPSTEVPTPVDLDSESTDSSLGSAFYARGARREGKRPAQVVDDDDSEPGEEGSYWSYDTEEDEEVGEVTREIDLCNYSYVPEPSEGEEYVPSAQPELEGEIFPRGGSSQDGESSSSARIVGPKILACRDLPTSLTVSSLSEAVEQYRLEGRVVLPRPHMRCYRFDYPKNGGRVPQMVLTTFLLKLGITSPLHPFIQDVYEYYHLAPLQINPNGYRAALALYIMYHNKGYPNLTAK